MTNIKKVEQQLRQYRLYKARLENLEEALELLKEEDGIGAIEYDSVMTGRTNKINNIVEDVGISKIEKEHYLRHLKKRSENIINSIDRALEALDSEEALVIKEWYFRNNTTKYISDLIGVSERTLFRIKDQALENISIALVNIIDMK